MEKAVDEAIKLGHSRLGYIIGKNSFRSSTGRKQGFLNSLLKAHVAVKPDYMVEGDYSMESGFAKMSQLLTLPNPPIIVFCANDDIAMEY